MDTIQSFLALSRILTGFDDLDAGLAERYHNRLTDDPVSGPVVTTILNLFEGFPPGPGLKDLVQEQIVGDDALRPTVAQMVLLWLTSATLVNTGPPIVWGYGEPDEYFSGLGWKLVGAHVLGLSGGYSGHWRYRPELGP
jgi:hypothetical protein